MLVASCYALGYAWAGSKRGWLPTLDRVNTATAFVIVAVIVLVFSPLVDPARIAVHSQLARLAAGRVSAQHFDFAFLRFDGARFGRAALDRLERQAAQAGGPDAAPTRQRIAAVRKLENPWNRHDLDQGPTDFAANLRPHPAGASLPASLLHADPATFGERWRLPHCLYLKNQACDAVQLDVNGDGKLDVVLLPVDGRLGGVLGEAAPGQWRLLGTINVGACGPVRAALLAGNTHSVEPALRDIEAAGVQLHVIPADPVKPDEPRCKAGG
jgi:hypothetical protein